MTFFIKKQLKRLIIILIVAYITLIGIGITVSDYLIFRPPAPTYALSEQSLIITSKNRDAGEPDNAIVAQYQINPDAEYTVLYSHGNASDLGQLQHLRQNFYEHGYSIMLYDYSGYGRSEGVASEQQVYNDVQAVYDFLVDTKKIDPAHIISYGHSLGTAIAADLAYRNPVAGLVLESPFTTAFRVKTVYSIVPFDKFATADKMKAIHAPVFITHSRDDRVIPFWHGEELYDIANSPKEFLALDGWGHMNITHSETFWTAFTAFVSGL